MKEKKIYTKKIKGKKMEETIQSWNEKEKRKGTR